MEYLAPPDEYRCDQFVLRRYRPDDGPLLRESVTASQEHLVEWLPWAGVDLTEELATRRVREFCGRWLLATDFLIAITDTDDTMFLGGCGYHLRKQPLGNLIAECGMWLRPERSGKGLGTAVLKALLTWGFSDWPWERIEWRCDARNTASYRAAEKAGMTQEGAFRHFRMKPEDEPRTSKIFAALRSEWSDD